MSYFLYRERLIHTHIFVDDFSLSGEEGCFLTPHFYHPRKPDEGLEAVVEPSRGVESPKCSIVSIGWGVVRIAFFLINKK